MNIPYRTRIMLQRIGLVVLTIAVFAALAWFCWVVWLERYVVYGRDGKATLNFDLPEQAQTGEVARPPAAEGGISIYYNEGADAVDNSGALTQLSGYYITYDDLSKNLAGVTEELDHVPAGTAVMKDRDGYRNISRRWTQGWGQGLALAFLAAVLEADKLAVDGAL